MTCIRVTAIFLVFLSFILNIIGLIIPYWKYSDTASTLKYYGLWKVCLTSKRYRHLEVCLELGVQYLSSSLKAVRALVILGEIGLFGAFIIGVAMYCWKRNQHLKFRADGILTILSGLLIIIGTAIFGSFIQFEPYISDANEHLHVGFALCVIAGCLAVIAGVVRVFFDNRRATIPQRNQTEQYGHSYTQPVYFLASPVQQSAVPTSQPAGYSYVTRNYTRPSSVLGSRDSDGGNYGYPLQFSGGDSSKEQTETTAPLPISNLSHVGERSSGQSEASPTSALSE